MYTVLKITFLGYKSHVFFWVQNFQSCVFLGAKYYAPSDPPPPPPPSRLYPSIPPGDTSQNEQTTQPKANPAP